MPQDWVAPRQGGYAPRGPQQPGEPPPGRGPASTAADLTVRLRRGSEAWVELADLLANPDVTSVGLVGVHRADGQYVRLLVNDRPPTPLLVADLGVSGEPPF